MVTGRRKTQRVRSDRLWFMLCFILVCFIVCSSCSVLLVQWNRRNEKGETVLHRACIEGNVKQVQCLIDQVGLAFFSVGTSLFKSEMALTFLRKYLMDVDTCINGPFSVMFVCCSLTGSPG